MPQNKIFRFGVFEADPGRGELRKSGVRVRLQEQPFQTLLILVARPGDVVSREELRQKLWPADTFVDFDHSLNTIINKLREVLGDTASSPRFIETLAKRGYRFLPAVEAVVSHDGDRGATLSTAPMATGRPLKTPQASTSVLTRPEELPPVPQGYVRVLFLLIQVMYLSFYIVALARLSRVEEILAEAVARSGFLTVALIVTAAIGIPIRFYLLSAISFDIRGLRAKFSKLFPALLILDELWALSPFLLSQKIGPGLALAIIAALIYVPFAQRTLVLMRES
jgi:cholera toxin transcriptional activator